MEFLDFPFMQRALLAGLVVGLVCSVLGVFVVLRGLSFIGAGVAHSAFGGVALGLILGLPVLGTALLFCIGVAVCIGGFSRSGRLKEDTSIGILFAATMAFGVFLLEVGELPNVDLASYLFGSILTVSSQDLNFSLWLGACVLLLLISFYKELIAIVFDEELARIAGLPVGFLVYMLLSLVAVTVVLSIGLVGIILVTALIVTPAATVLQWVRDVDYAIVASAVLGVVATEAGLIGAYYLDLSPGPAIVMLMTAIFVLSLILQSFRKSQLG